MVWDVYHFLGYLWEVDHGWSGIVPTLRGLGSLAQTEDLLTVKFFEGETTQFDFRCHIFRPHCAFLSGKLLSLTLPLLALQVAEKLWSWSPQLHAKLVRGSRPAMGSGSSSRAANEERFCEAAFWGGDDFISSFFSALYMFGREALVQELLSRGSVLNTWLAY